MSYGLAFGFPRASLAAAASPFSQLGPTLDLNFAGAPTTGLVSNNNSLDLNFTGQQYSVGAPYMVWSGTSMTAESFQDIVTFSRASANATYYNSSGYLTLAGVLNYLTYSNQPENAAWTKSNSFVQTNLLTYSEDITNGVWLMLGTAGGSRSANVTTAPNGTMTADSFSVGTGTGAWYIANYLTPSVVNGQSYTSSMYLKANGYNFAFIRPHNNTSSIGASGFIVSLIDGTITYPSAGSAPTSTGTATNVGNGWWRVSATSTANATLASLSGGPGVWPCPSTDFINAGGAGPANFTGDGTSGIYIWGGQFVQGAVPGDYQATTSAALPVLYADYTGALRARKLCEDATATTTHRILPNLAITVDAAGVYTYSWYVKAGELTEARLTDNNVLGATFNLSTGASSSVSAGYTPSAVNLGNGWWRLSISAIAGTVSGRILIYLSKAGNQTYTGDGSSGIYIADAQLNDGLTATAYYDTTQYPYNAPRFDYDPVTLAAKGFLVEDQRTNLLLYSEQFDNTSSWLPITATVSPNTVLSPDGTISADTLTSSGVAGIQRVSQTVTQTGVSTFSIYAKAGTAQFLQLLHASDANCYANFDLSAGTVGTFGTGSTSTITAVGSGWYRCTLSFNIPFSSNWQIYIVSSASATYGLAFTATVASLFLWGAQSEAGAFASSYIPTVASQLTRAADLADINTLSPWFNQRAGTYFVSASYYSLIPATGSRGGFFGMGPYAAANSINAFSGGGSTTLAVYFTSTSYPDVVMSGNLNTAAYATNKIAFGYNQNTASYGLSTNGAAATTATSTQNNATFTALALGRRDATTSNLLNGHIQRISYYPRRLTNTELQTLTT